VVFILWMCSSIILETELQTVILLQKAQQFLPARQEQPERSSDDSCILGPYIPVYGKVPKVLQTTSRNAKGTRFLKAKLKQKACASDNLKT
jgi:hypothetical protein